MAGLLLYLIFFSSFEEVSDEQMVDQIRIHSGLGVLIILLAVFRLYWRRAKPRPETIQNAPHWQIIAAHLTHHLFYILFLLGPVFGFKLAGLVAYRVNIFGVFDIAGWLADNPDAAGLVNSFHGFVADVLIALIVFHVAAALYHQFVKGDGLIWRMLPFGPAPKV
jgi:cytochrome b561